LAKKRKEIGEMKDFAVFVVRLTTMLPLALIESKKKISLVNNGSKK